MGIREYWSELWAAIKKSWTMNVGALFVVLGVLELNLSLVKPFIGEKFYAVTTIVVAAVLAVARLKGLDKQVRNK